MIEISKFKNANVLVIGDVMLDHYLYGSTDRISPEAPVPVVRVEREIYRIGGAGNVAANVAALGGRVKLLAVAGADPEKDQISRLLTDAGVNHHLAPSREPTIKKSRIVAKSQQLLRIDFESYIAPEDHSAFSKEFKRSLGQVQVVVISDYKKGSVSDPAIFIAEARDQGKFVIVDPKGSDFTAYRHASLITPNLLEFETIVGKCTSFQEIEDKGQFLCRTCHFESILVTLSERGALLVRPDEKFVHFPSKAKEVFDVTGAGDTVVATLATAIASGSTMLDAVQVANAAAGIAVSHAGAVQVSADELSEVLFEGELKTQSKFRELGNVLEFVEQARSYGKRIVMTNGCFDILHLGHVRYLQHARRLGDLLIIAVNDDASIQRLKGDARPINPLAARMEVLSALACVDCILPFSEDTPEQLYAAIRPDVLVKGADYAGKTIAGSDHVIAAGGRVELIEFFPGFSTTETIKKIGGI